MVRVDGDVLVYTCGFAAEKWEYDVRTKDGACVTCTGKKAVKAFLTDNELAEDDVEITERHVVEPVENALHTVNTKIKNIKRDCGTKQHRMFLSTSYCFREDVATLRPYKGNRADAPKPVHYQAIRDHLLNRWGAELVDGYEADDLLAIEYDPRNEIIASIDKDMLQVPGKHFVWNKPEGQQIINITEEQGLYNLYVQILAGDLTDNIPGCPGIGMGKAAKLLCPNDTEQEMYAAALSVYEERWPEDSELSPREAMHETAKLVYILRGWDDNWEAPNV